MLCDWAFSGDKNEIATCKRCGTEINLRSFSRRMLHVPCLRKEKPRSSTAVVIPCHNYGRFLAWAIDSVLAQTVEAVDILVIDDCSTDDTAEVAMSYADSGVRYIRTKNKHVHKNRMLGAAETLSEFLIFLDADDMLPPEYIESAEKVARSDLRVGIVYTDCKLFGIRSGLVIHNKCDIEQRNYMHCASLVRRSALDSVIWDKSTTSGYTHNDWYMWRQVVRAGWHTAKSEVPLMYRQHEQSMMHVVSGKLPYKDYSAIDEEVVQIVLPLSGRREWLKRLMKWVERQNQEKISVLVSDTSADPKFRTKVKKWLSRLKCETQYLPLPSTNGLADKDRVGSLETVRKVQLEMPRIYNQIVRRLNRTYVMWVEDDVLPPDNAIEKLSSSMDYGVACVAGVVRSRYLTKPVIAWDHYPPSVNLAERGKGVERIHGTGFGCLFARTSVLKDNPLHAGGVTGNYDPEFARSVELADMQWLIDWDVLCDHAGLAGEDVPLR